MGTGGVSRPEPAFYTRTGSTVGDLLSLMHWPYTVWHLSYVVIGAALAPKIDSLVLIGTLFAFLFALGIGAHALDELHDRPLGTALSPGVLRALGWGGLAVGGGFAVTGAFVVSTWALAWGALGILLAAAYTLEWVKWIHSDPGFALSWGGFPALVGYWSQTGNISLAAVLVAVAATATSLAQRQLSTPARQVRRRARDASATVGDETWDRTRLLGTWERPLFTIAMAHVLLAGGMLATHFS